MTVDVEAVRILCDIRVSIHEVAMSMAMYIRESNESNMNDMIAVMLYIFCMYVSIFR